MSYIDNANQLDIKLEDVNDEKKKKIIAEAMDEEKQRDFYQKLRTKINNYISAHPHSKYIKYLVAAPDLFHLMCKLLADRRVPFGNKVLVGAAVVYFISPLDLISDLLPGIGLMDDIAIAVCVLNKLLKSVDKKIIDELWAGDEDLIEFFEDFLAFSDSDTGGKFLKKIVGFGGKRR